MARYSQDVLDRLKRETDLPGLVRAKGIELTRHGQDLIGLCPFHNDTKPSLVVTQKKGSWLWHCLGACARGGDAIEWVMQAEGVSFRHAVEILLELNSGQGLIAREKIIRTATIPYLTSPISPEADTQTALHQVIDYYHETLKKSDVALAYLEKRGIKNDEAITTFRLGFADRTLGLRLPKRNRREGSEIRERLIELGLIRDSGHEHFNGCIVFPIMNEEGHITEVYGRKINDGIRAGLAYHLYLPGPHKGIWNPKALASDTIMLCESLIDALTFWVNGYRNVTTSYGVNGFTDELFEALIAHKVKTVYLAYDRDEAGNNAAEKTGKRLLDAGITCFRVTFPRGMDVNEYALRVTPAHKSLRLLVNSATWMGNGHKPDEVSLDRDDADFKTSPEACAEKDTIAASQSDSNQEEAWPKGSRSTPAAAQQKNGPDDRDQPSTWTTGDITELRFDDRAYRIIGLKKNMAYGVLKINLRLLIEERYHVDTLDLYNFRARTAFIQTAARETGCDEELIKADIGKILLKLEELQETNIKRAQEPTTKKIVLSDADRHEALTFLKRNNLLDCILKDFDSCGVVGETTNKLIGYLACVSRNLHKPLGIIIQSSSAAGKTYLMESILSFIPTESWKKYSAMTGQSLFYMGETDLKYKVLAIVEEEGANRASYSLKLLQSEGELTIASTGKDPITGKLITREYRIEGPVVIIITTTTIDIDEELQNRCIILTVNEDRDQTRAIHSLQRELETLEGHRIQQEWDHIRTIHRNAHRLLRPLTVINPYARHLTFLDTKTRTRRDHMKYLTLIKSIALLHQYQRPIKTDIYRNKPTQYIEVTLDDIEIANKLASEALGRSLDELTPQTRRFLCLLDEYVREECLKRKMNRRDYRFSRREVREATGWSYDQVRTHIDRLVALEYVLVHRGGRGQSFVYELLYDGKGKDGGPFLMGLIDVEALRTNQQTTTMKSLVA